MYFCRVCSYRGQFVAKPEEEIRCPKCDKSIMRRQDVEWAKRTQVDGDAGEEVRGNG